MQTTPPIEVLITDIIDTLNIEKSRILAGQYRDLEKISKRKLRNITALQQYTPTPQDRMGIASHTDDIELIKIRAAENAILLSAAKEGASSARFRIQKMAERARSVGTYVESGTKLESHESVVTLRTTA